MYFFISNNEGYLTLFDSDEKYKVCDLTSKRHSKSSVKSFWKLSNSLQIQLGVTTITVSSIMKPCTKHITMKYHPLWDFVVKGDAVVNHIYSKEQVMDIFTIILDT